MQVAGCKYKYGFVSRFTFDISRTTANIKHRNRGCVSLNDTQAFSVELFS